MSLHVAAEDATLTTGIRCRLRAVHGPVSPYPRRHDDGDGGDDWLALDKSWHGVHFLLTGTAWGTDDPLGGAVLGGREVGEDDGYGPPRLLEPDGVRTVADALEGATDAELRGRFDAEQMQRLDIYPQIWGESDILDEYLMPNVAALREFYARAAARHAAVLIAVQ